MADSEDNPCLITSLPLDNIFDKINNIESILSNASSILLEISNNRDGDDFFITQTNDICKKNDKIEHSFLQLNRCFLNAKEIFSSIKKDLERHSNSIERLQIHDGQTHQQEISQDVDRFISPAERRAIDRLISLVDDRSELQDALGLSSGWQINRGTDVRMQLLSQKVLDINIKNVHDFFMKNCIAEMRSLSDIETELLQWLMDKGNLGKPQHKYLCFSPLKKNTRFNPHRMYSLTPLASGIVEHILVPGIDQLNLKSLVETRKHKFFDQTVSNQKFTLSFCPPPEQIDVTCRYRQGYWIMTTPVTIGLWKNVMHTDPSSGSDLDVPVACVSWYDALFFANELSNLEGRSPCYDLKSTSSGHYEVRFDEQATGYRLPGSREWQYAATADSEYKFSGSNQLDEVGWYSVNSGGKLHAVAQKQANPWSIYDMSGNVSEWIADPDSEQPMSRVGERVPVHYAPFFLNRYTLGGNFKSNEQACTTLKKSQHLASEKETYIGFRLIVEKKHSNQN